ncbi:hypothetical protein HOO54_15680 [Bacillus sp. WMMC1349]|uniref:hypothetical protein n=1 Tax=Bacillus sp. WMMC1349 TaxID=2736254 RepID=UPI001556823D|nr:hypothetical protein [Bacillus sp. WMMC1349]NPC93634.1 hypothetical protein [Bacillus sp. WMMC1349]
MTNMPSYEQLEEQYELTVLKSAAYKETLDQAHNDLAEVKAFYMREKQKRQNLEQEVEKLKKELQEERVGHSQTHDEVNMEDVNGSKGKNKT